MDFATGLISLAGDTIPPISNTNMVDKDLNQIDQIQDAYNASEITDTDTIDLGLH